MTRTLTRELACHLLSILATKTTLNKRECVALLRLVIDNSPGASAGNRQLGMKVLTFLVDQLAHTQWPQEITMLNPMWDLALAMEYSAMKAEHVAIEDWWTSYQHLAAVLPVSPHLG